MRYNNEKCKPTACFDKPSRNSPTAIPPSVIANLPILCFSCQHVSELHVHYSYFFVNLHLHVFHVQFCCFHTDRSNARDYRAFKKSTLHFMGIIYKHFFSSKFWFIFTNKKKVHFFHPTAHL